MKKNQNKYLSFMLGNECYGLRIITVKEIIGMQSITRIPNMPKYIKGVINLRGQIIPVLDLRIRFGLDEKEYSDRTCIIIIENNALEETRFIGLIVDGVSEVVEVDKLNISEAINQGETKDNFLRGIAKTKDIIILLLEESKLVLVDDQEKVLLSKKNEEN